jgi:hypothetical protein
VAYEDMPPTVSAENVPETSQAIMVIESEVPPITQPLQEPTGKDYEL